MHQTSEWNLESSAGYPEPHIESIEKDLKCVQKCQIDSCIGTQLLWASPDHQEISSLSDGLSKGCLMVPLSSEETWPQTSFGVFSSEIILIF